MDEILGALLGGGLIWCFLAFFLVENLQLGLFIYRLFLVDESEFLQSFFFLNAYGTCTLHLFQDYEEEQDFSHDSIKCCEDLTKKVNYKDEALVTAPPSDKFLQDPISPAQDEDGMFLSCAVHLRQARKLESGGLSQVLW